MFSLYVSVLVHQKRSCEEAEKRRTLLPDIPLDVIKKCDNQVLEYEWLQS